MLEAIRLKRLVNNEAKALTEYYMTAAAEKGSPVSGEAAATVVEKFKENLIKMIEDEE